MTLVHLTQDHCDFNTALERERREHPDRITEEEFKKLHYEEIGDVPCHYRQICSNRATHYRDVPCIGVVPLCGWCEDRI